MKTEVKRGVDGFSFKSNYILCQGGDLEQICTETPCRMGMKFCKLRIQCFSHVFC